jgi:hypothetical protein
MKRASFSSPEAGSNASEIITSRSPAPNAAPTRQRASRDSCPHPCPHSTMPPRGRIRLSSNQESPFRQILTKLLQVRGKADLQKALLKSFPLHGLPLRVRPVRRSPRCPLAPNSLRMLIRNAGFYRPHRLDARGPRHPRVSSHPRLAHLSTRTLLGQDSSFRVLSRC